MKLREFMRTHNLTEEGLASLLQVKPSYLKHLLSGQRKPSRKLMARIIQVSDGRVTMAEMWPDIADKLGNVVAASG